MTFKVAFVAAGVVPEGVVAAGVDVVGLDVVGEVVELLHATTVSANIRPPRTARRIYGSSEVCSCTTRAKVRPDDRQP
jgi:hypothetical protein